MAASSSIRTTLPGAPITSAPGGIRLPSGISAPAPIRAPAPISAPFRTMAPIPISAPSWTVQPCSTALCPTVTSAPSVSGKPMSV